MADDTDPEHLNLEGVLNKLPGHFDGGYVVSGLVGNW